MKVLSIKDGKFYSFEHIDCDGWDYSSKGISISSDNENIAVFCPNKSNKIKIFNIKNCKDKVIYFKSLLIGAIWSNNSKFIAVWGYCSQMIILNLNDEK